MSSIADHPWDDAFMAGLYDLFPFEADLPLYRELAAAQGGRVLELACGSGRVLVPLVQAGNRVVGLDASPHMLALARAKLDTGTSARLIQGDMRDFQLDMHDFDLAISNQANPSEPVPSTTQYYTTDGIKKGVPFRNASGFSLPAMDALVEKIKVETDPAKRKALVVEFQKMATLEAPNLPLVELESITVASTRVQNHSNDPNYLAASWYDIWLSA